VGFPNEIDVGFESKIGVNIDSKIIDLSLAKRIEWP
jgi:hypothetical protein